LILTVVFQVWWWI